MSRGLLIGSVTKMVHYILFGIGNYDNFTSEPMSLSKAKEELENHIRELKNNCPDYFSEAKRFYQDDMTFKIGNEEFYQEYDIWCC